MRDDVCQHIVSVEYAAWFDLRVVTGVVCAFMQPESPAKCSPDLRKDKNAMVGFGDYMVDE